MLLTILLSKKVNKDVKKHTKKRIHWLVRRFAYTNLYLQDTI